MRIMKKILGLLAALSVLVLSQRARATTMTVCVRFPVTLTDATGKSNEIGTNGNWAGRGVRIGHVTQPNGVNVSGFPLFANPSTGCFSFATTQTGVFNISVLPWGTVAGNNIIKVRNTAGTIPSYEADVSLSGSGGTVIWPVESILLRMYAIYAYSIQEGFRGNYDNEELDVWYNQPPPGGTECNSTTSENDNLSHIGICDWATQDKFLMAHEYGHANLQRSINFNFVDDCSYGSGGHGMRGLEMDSCAAMEGWAHFVAADIWNNGIHDGGDPHGWFTYWASGPPIIDVEAGQGGCATSDTTALNYRANYADNCYPTDIHCAGGNCAGYGNELDWMRFWWDFHTDGDAVGFRPSHSDLQEGIDASGGWGSTDAWESLHDGLSGTQQTRFQNSGNWNGTSEP